MWAILARIEASHGDLKDVDVGDLLMYGPWASADAVLENVAAATKGRALAPNALLSFLVGDAGDYFFFERIIEAPPPAAAGAGADSDAVAPSLAGAVGGGLGFPLNVAVGCANSPRSSLPPRFLPPSIIG